MAFKPIMVIALGGSAPAALSCDSSGQAIAIGDSRTAEDGPAPWPGRVTKKAVENLAVGGTKWPEIQAVGDGAVLRQNDVVILQAGVNDIVHLAVDGPQLLLNQRAWAETKAMLGIRVIIMSMPAFGAFDSDPVKLSSRRCFNAAFRNAAEANTTSMTYLDIAAQLDGPNDELASPYSLDGIHYTVAAHDVIAAMVDGVLP